MDFAAHIAPVIDRLVLAVNTAAEAESRPAVAGITVEIGLDTPELLKHYADFLLAGRLTEDLAVRRLPYHPEDVVRERVATWRQLGLIAPAENGLGAALVPLLHELLDGRRRVAEALWQDQPASDGALHGTGLALAAVPAEFELAIAHRDLPETSDPHLRLHDRLTTCRYVRSQAHAGAWRARGLDRPEILALTAVWHGTGSEDGSALASLAERGLLDLSRTSLTTEGRRLREEIESDTNRTTAPMFDAIGGPERTALADSLAALPGVPL
jgi:hypothetical protein